MSNFHVRAMQKAYRDTMGKPYRDSSSECITYSLGFYDGAMWEINNSLKTIPKRLRAAKRNGNKSA